jgi:hypothetical protein
MADEPRIDINRHLGGLGVVGGGFGVLDGCYELLA